MSDKTILAAIDEVYAERNAVVLGFATLAALVGCRVGHVTDASEPDWPVLMIDTPEGQVSWHFRAEDMPPEIPPYDGEWDGHDTPEKYARLRAMVDSHWRFIAANPATQGTDDTTADPQSEGS